MKRKSRLLTLKMLIALYIMMRRYNNTFIFETEVTKIWDVIDDISRKYTNINIFLGVSAIDFKSFLVFRGEKKHWKINFLNNVPAGWTVFLYLFYFNFIVVFGCKTQGKPRLHFIPHTINQYWMLAKRLMVSQPPPMFYAIALAVS